MALNHAPARVAAFINETHKTTMSSALEGLLPKLPGCDVLRPYAAIRTPLGTRVVKYGVSSQNERMETK